jgi:hypothetical protein
MPRTTIDLDGSVLRELKKRQQREGKTLGRLISEMLAESLRRVDRPAPPPFAWSSRPMNAKVDLEDKEALRRVLDEA